jgi:hypothetical protein
VSTKTKKVIIQTNFLDSYNQEEGKICSINMENLIVQLISGNSIKEDDLNLNDLKISKMKIDVSIDRIFMKDLQVDPEVLFIRFIV